MGVTLSTTSGRSATADIDALSTDVATEMVRRYVDPSLTVTAVRLLHGGMVHRVCELITDGEPASIVAKLNDADHADAFEREMETLEWYRRQTSFPVPRPYETIRSVPGFPCSGLLMEKIDGPNLADARLSPRGRKSIQHQLAQYVAELHSHHRDSYGLALEEHGHARWLDVFGPTIEREFDAVKHLLTSRNRWTIQEMIHHLEDWLPEQATPTLVHGDLWATNILVDDRHPDRPRLLAFVDCGASYCDPEYELAYLRVFRTADQHFFDLYAQRHPLRPGFDRRCRVYWLNTIMLHVRMFGDQYLPRCEALAQQIRQLA